MQPFPEQQLQGNIRDRHFIEHRDKSAAHSRQLLSPDRHFPSDPWEVLRPLFRVVCRLQALLCRTDDAPKSWGVLLQSLVPFLHPLVRFLVGRDLFFSHEREGTCFVLGHWPPLEINDFPCLLAILLFSSISAFMTYCNNSCHPLFLFVLLFIPLIWF